MTTEELQALVEKVSLEDFKRPFLHEAVFNKRLKTTGGRYHLKDHHLDFNPRMLSLKEEVFIQIIRHELCHYHLHLAGLPYQHKDATFKRLLQQVHGLRYAPVIESERLQKTFLYQCQNCQQKYLRRRRMNVKRYVCGKCRGKLKLVPKI